MFYITVAMQHRTTAADIAKETAKETAARLKENQRREAERKRKRRAEKRLREELEKARIVFEEHQRFCVAWSRWAEHYEPLREVTRKRIDRDDHSYFPEDTYEIGTRPVRFGRFD